MCFKVRQLVILLNLIYCISSSYCVEDDEYLISSNNQNKIPLNDNNKFNEQDKNSIQKMSVQNINERIQKAIDYLNERVLDHFSNAKITYISPVSKRGKGLLSRDDTFNYIQELHELSNNIKNKKNIISNEQVKQLEYIEYKVIKDSNKKNEILKQEVLEGKSNKNIEKQKASKSVKKINNVHNNINIENEETKQEREMTEIVNHTISIDTAKKYMSSKNNNVNVKLFYEELAKTADEIIKNNKVHELKLLRNFFKNEYSINKDTNTWEQKFAYCLARYIDLNINRKNSNALHIISSMLRNNEINDSQYESLLKLLLYTDYIACLSQKSYSFDEIDKLIKEIDKIIVKRINKEYYKNIVLNLVKPILKKQILREVEKFNIENSENNQKLRYKNILKFAFKNLREIIIEGLTYAILPVIEQNAMEHGKQSGTDQDKELNRIKEFLRKNDTINSTINRCVIQILNLPEYFDYIKKCYKDIYYSDNWKNKLHKETISLIKGIENIKYDKKYDNEDTLLFCKYIVKELNSLINKKVYLNYLREYKVEKHLLFDIFLNCDYMFYNIDTDLFYKYITELHENKYISNNEYKAGLDFLLYQNILSGSCYLPNKILISYINALLPTSEKEWKSIIIGDIKNNRTKQNSVLINEIMNNIIKIVNYWNKIAKEVYVYKNKNEYFNVVFNEKKITKNMQNYITNEIVNNKNYDMLYSIYFNKRNTFNKWYTLLTMFKRYNKSNEDKIEKDNKYTISTIVDNFHKLCEDNENTDKNLELVQYNNEQIISDSSLQYILKHTLSNVLTTEQKVYFLSDSINKITKNSYNEYIENYINNIIKYCNLDYKELIKQEINNSKQEKTILYEILKININKDNKIKDLINIKKILQTYSNNLKYADSSSKIISSVNTLIYILGDFLLKFDLVKNPNFNELTLNGIINMNQSNKNKEQEKPSNFIEEID